jgi:O-antigen ligase
MANDLRKDLGHLGAAHTEFTRVLAEHGILGLISELILFLLMWRIFRATRLVSSRATVVALLIWSLLFLLINAMRLATPSFLTGVACAIAYSFRPRPKPVKAATP